MVLLRLWVLGKNGLVYLGELVDAAKQGTAARDEKEKQILLLIYKY